MRYGLGYQGSKNMIARKVVDVLPPADTLVDLFAGGCAITHCAMEQGKYKNYIINDIDGGITQLFVDGICGKYRNEKRWISREDFFRLKETDPYVKYCWSFGNNGEAYMFAKEKELWKKALWYARVLDDFSIMHDIGIYTAVDRKGCREHFREYDDKYRAYIGKNIKMEKNAVRQLQSLQRLERLESLERLQRLQSMESLESLEPLQNMQRFNLDYADVPIPDNSIIYCDIPYNNTDCGSYSGFDYKRFYEWAKDKDNIFISEYDMPKPFIEIFSVKKTVLLSNRGTEQNRATEKIYTTQKTIDKFRLYEQNEQTEWSESL